MAWPRIDELKTKGYTQGGAWHEAGQGGHFERMAWPERGGAWPKGALITHDSRVIVQRVINRARVGVMPIYPALFKCRLRRMA